MAWLSDWKLRRKITIDETKIDAALSNFPIAIRISSASGPSDIDLTDIFDEIGSNSLRLAVTTSDGTTQCYVEVAYWNSTSELGILFVKIPSISSSADTEFYIYFDNTKSDNSSYVGLVESTPGKQVWDSDFIGVFHLVETPSGSNSIKNSTIVSAHGTNVNTPVLTDGLLDKALDFERGDSDYITIPGKTERILDSGPSAYSITNQGAYIDPTLSKIGSGSIFFDSWKYCAPADSTDWILGGTGADKSFCIEGWVRFRSLPSTGTAQAIWSQYANSNNRLYFWLYNNSGTYLFSFFANSGGAVKFNSSWTVSVSTDTWYHFALSRDSSNNLRFFLDGTQVGSDVSNSNECPDLYPPQLGAYNASSFLIGYLDEFRISNVARYTSNFTPSTTEFSSDSNTKLLLHGDVATFSLKKRSAATYEALFRLESLCPSGQSPGFIWESTNSTGYTRFGLMQAYEAADDTRLQGIMRDSETGTVFSAKDTVTLAIDTWYHGAIAVDTATEDLKLYKNGSNVASDATAKGGFLTTQPADDIQIGSAGGGTKYYHDGLLDEVRISGIARSAAWLKATYHTLFDDLLGFDSAEPFEYQTALGYAQLEVAAYAFTIELAETYKANLGLAQLQIEAFSISWAKAFSVMSLPSVSSRKPIAAVASARPAFSVSSKKPFALSSGDLPSSVSSGKKPKGVASVEVS